MAALSPQETQPGSERLALLYRISQTLNSSLELDYVLNSVMDEVIAATNAERGFLMLGEASGQMAFRAARGMDQQTIEQPAFQVSRGVVERVVREGRALLTSNAQSDDWLSARQSVNILGLRSILCVPLQLKGALLGVIYVDNRLQTGIFTPADLDLLSAIAANAAVAIENARLYQVAVEKGRMERELQVARDVQTSLLPRETPQLPGWEFAAQWRPAREVAGDYYDFISTDRRHLGLVIADVADKGMAAALFMALTRSTVRASLVHTSSPARGMAQANRLICADAADGMFVTLFYAQLDPLSGQVIYVNCGHNPPLLYRATSDDLVRLTATTMALGIEEDARIEQRAVQLNMDDFILLYTDGATEATDAAGEPFGEGRLRDIVYEHRQAPAAEIVAAVPQALEQFVGPQPPFDDTTLVVVKRTTGGAG